MWLLSSLVYIKSLREPSSSSISLVVVAIARGVLHILNKLSLMHLSSHFGILSGTTSSPRSVSVILYSMKTIFIDQVSLYHLPKLDHSQVFNSLRNIIHGLVAFFTSCNQHRQRYIHLHIHIDSDSSMQYLYSTTALMHGTYHGQHLQPS